jgi:mono/diheme cytochrome c family protein
MTSRRLKLPVLIGLAAVAFSGCGTEKLEFDSGENDRVKEGGRIFAERCSGCHSLAEAATEGSATNIRDRERTDGPNFDTRPETVEAVLYAIRNGGFSGAIMPENIVVGDEAQKVAEYLAKYAGREAEDTVSPKTPAETPDSAAP